MSESTVVHEVFCASFPVAPQGARKLHIHHFLLCLCIAKKHTRSTGSTVPQMCFIRCRARRPDAQAFWPVVCSVCTVVRRFSKKSVMQCKEGYPYLSICKNGCQVVSQTFVYANFEFFIKKNSHPGQVGIPWKVLSRNEHRISEAEEAVPLLHRLLICR